MLCLDICDARLVWRRRCIHFFSKHSNNFHYTTKTFKFLSTLLHVVFSIFLLVVWYLIETPRFVRCLLYYFSPIAWVTVTNINNTTEAINGRMFLSVLKGKKLKEKINGKVITVMAPFKGHVFIVSIWFDNK